MTIKHRKARRVSVSQLVMQAQGECAAGPFYGIVGNLSLHGCFFVTYANVQIKEIVNAQILLPTERWLHIEGEVSHRAERAGFGVRFLNLTEAEKASLELVIDYAQGLNDDAEAGAEEAEQTGDSADGSDPAERRRYPRAAVAADLPGATEETTSAIADISMGGLFLRTTANLRIGQTMTLRLPLGTGQPLEVEVEVVHVQPGRGVGLNFLWQGEDDPARARLAREIAQ